MPDPTPRVLAVIPHPDDESYAMAATLHTLGLAGARVSILCATRGDRGDDFSASAGPGPGNLASKRSAELAASCAVLGAEPPRFLDLPDGGLAALPPGRLEAALVEAITALAPHVIFALGPDGAYGHADHLALGEALSQAVAWLRPDPRVLRAVFPQGLFEPQWQSMTEGDNATLVAGAPPDGPAPVLGVSADAPDLRVAVAESLLAKRASISAHRSQLHDREPESLFPRGIVTALLAEEWFQQESGPPLPEHAAGIADPLAGLDF
jgi:LmbE family N-acetylglucosaminyl deacetylase